MNLDFSAPGRILFGCGRLDEAAREVSAWSDRVLLLTGGDPSRAEPLRVALAAAGSRVRTWSHTGEPRVEDLSAVLAVAREFSAGAVVAVGGGSVLDLGKAVAALAPHDADPMDHLEVVGRGRPLPGPGLPFAAVPTTAGTGSEATRNAVLGARGVKASLRGPQLMPRLALVDPSFALDLPRQVTAWSGMDALVQLLEPLVSRFANPLVDGLCRTGIPLSVRSLPVALDHPRDLAARADLALASLLSGMALANAKLGAVHGLAGPLGGAFPAPHGALCARLLVPVWKANLAASDRVPGARERFLDASRLLAGSVDADLADGLRELERLSGLCAAPGLSRWGMTESDIPRVREAGLRASSMKGNPVELFPEEVDGILREALG